MSHRLKLDANIAAVVIAKSKFERPLQRGEQ